jgi:arabinoxylan arabinofuranohydrolase
MDDDSSAYLLFGQNTVNIVKLNNDMVSFNDTVHTVKGVNHFFEAVWMHKYNGQYYISYSGKGKILYGMSNSPYGPFTYKGVLLGKVNSGTNHASIVSYKGQWYLFYYQTSFIRLFSLFAFVQSKKLNKLSSFFCPWVLMVSSIFSIKTA